jgi:hypothetical protein
MRRRSALVDATRITQADVDIFRRCRAAGFTDHEICDIALCAAFPLLSSCRFFRRGDQAPTARRARL